jgi:hypothetical protein
MRNSKLYSILEYFNKYEQNRLRKFLISPYFNKNEALIKLFDALTNQINLKGSNASEWNKEELWAVLYPTEVYDDVFFRKNCSDLLKLIEDYLAQQVYEENPIHQATYLIEAVGKKKMVKLFNSVMKSARRLSSQQIQKPGTFYLYQYLVEKNYYELSQSDLNRAEKTNIEDIAQNLDAFYLTEKLRLYCSVLNQQYVVSHEYKLLFIDEIVSHLKKYQYEKFPPISIYYQVYLTITDSENVQHYFVLKNLLEKHGLDFPQSEALTIYHSAINYCIRNVNKGDLSFLRELFDLYKDILKKEIILSDGNLSPWDFKNIVTCSVRLGELSWTEDFIKQYSMLIPEMYRENAVSFNLAQLYFYQKKYGDLITLLQTVEYEDFSYNLNAKGYLLFTYYEMDEIEPLFSLLESFRAYLNRHKNYPKHRREMYINLIKFTKKLVSTKSGDKKSIAMLKEEIMKTKNLSGQEWLLEKLAELE